MRIEQIIKTNQPVEYKKLAKYKIPKFLLWIEKVMDKITDPIVERMLRV